MTGSSVWWPWLETGAFSRRDPVPLLTANCTRPLQRSSSCHWESGLEREREREYIRGEEREIRRWGIEKGGGGGRGYPVDRRSRGVRKERLAWAVTAKLQRYRKRRRGGERAIKELSDSEGEEVERCWRCQTNGSHDWTCWVKLGWGVVAMLGTLGRGALRATLDTEAQNGKGPKCREGKIVQEEGRGSEGKWEKPRGGDMMVFSRWQSTWNHSTKWRESRKHFNRWPQFTKLVCAVAMHRNCLIGLCSACVTTKWAKAVCVCLPKSTPPLNGIGQIPWFASQVSPFMFG